MAIEHRLSLRLSQRLVMTPMLQQAIQLLQLSTIELQELLERELTENPLLEEMPVEEPASEPPTLSTAPPSPVENREEAPPVDGQVPDDLPFDLTAVMFDHPEELSLVQQEEHEDLPFENFSQGGQSLTEYLTEQLRMVAYDPAIDKICRAIIGNLDDDGYLRISLEELAEACQSTMEEVQQGLAMVQSFDPPGVAARNCQECILLQLRADPQPDPVALEIAEHHFQSLERRRYPEIARALKLALDRVMEAVEEIAGLEPKPGRKFASADARYIVPDVFVYKMGNDYTIVLNEDGIPRLRVNTLYRSMLAKDGGSETRQYVEQKLRSALWLIKSVHQRQRTLYRVTESIVKFQREFLDHGISALRPLALKDVAEDISMHESTVSRVTTNKYVQTPQGLFELKYFFHSGIASSQGEMVSSLSVKKMIQDLVAQEDPSRPLSDQEIGLRLKSHGLNIARRTVAKYREELGILPSHQRRLAPKKAKPLPSATNPKSQT